jgi:hypothetical protein
LLSDAAKLRKLTSLARIAGAEDEIAAPLPGIIIPPIGVPAASASTNSRSTTANAARKQSRPATSAATTTAANAATTTATAANAAAAALVPPGSAGGRGGRAVCVPVKTLSIDTATTSNNTSASATNAGAWRAARPDSKQYGSGEARSKCISPQCRSVFIVVCSWFTYTYKYNIYSPIYIYACLYI